MTESSQRFMPDIAICAALVLAIAIIFAQVVGFDFITVDDSLYVTNNPDILTGISARSFQTALTGSVAGNWIPVTQLSFALDIQLFGRDSGMDHVVNVFWHAVATVLLYVVLKRATKQKWPSAFVAAVFAVHPLHVESVAWISERKDVLSAVFWFLTMWLYIRYVEAPAWQRYLLVLVSFSLGLMAKPMLVTLPLALLLFDIWPLRRPLRSRLIWEKVPMLFLAAADAVITYLVQKSVGAPQPVPLAAGVGNALLSYVTYLRDCLYPVNLAIFYPYPKRFSVWLSGMYALALLGTSWLIASRWRTKPWYALGWFWFLGTLVPVIGLVQVGMQARADRYMYIPIIGIAILAAWGGAEVVATWPGLKPTVAGLAGLWLVAMAGIAFADVAHWQNAETVYTQAVRVTKDNFVAHGNLGAYLLAFPQRRAEALEQFREALQIDPDYAEAHVNMGLALAVAGLCEAALPHFDAARRFKPSLVNANSRIVARCLAQVHR